MAKVGEVAYTLQLPPDTRIHPTFHVSQLKRHIGQQPASATLPPAGLERMLLKEPSRFLDRHITKRGHQAFTEVLVKWANSFPEDASWEILSVLQQQYPNFDPWGQGSLEARSSAKG